VVAIGFEHLRCFQAGLHSYRLKSLSVDLGSKRGKVFGCCNIRKPVLQATVLTIHGVGFSCGFFVICSFVRLRNISHMKSRKLCHDLFCIGSFGIV